MKLCFRNKPCFKSKAEVQIVRLYLRFTGIQNKHVINIINLNKCIKSRSVLEYVREKLLAIYYKCCLLYKIQLVARSGRIVRAFVLDCLLDDFMYGLCTRV